MYTLAMHSGGAWGGKPVFERAVEQAACSAKEVRAVKKVGGLLFATYTESAEAADLINYPPGVAETMSLNPRVRGRFSSVKVDSRRVYVAHEDDMPWVIRERERHERERIEAEERAAEERITNAPRYAGDDNDFATALKRSMD